jgi:uncharacterized protein YqeY
MTIQERLTQNMKTALKSNDKVQLETIRLLRSQLQNAGISKGKELTEEEVIEVMIKEVKKRKESIKMFEDGGRQDLVDRETQELEILSSYLPKALDEKELEEIVNQAIKEVSAESSKDMGKVMAVVMPKIKGRADGKQVQELVKKKLS